MIVSVLAISLSLAMDNSSRDTVFPRMVHICIPPDLQASAQALAAETPPVHPAWKKGKQRGRHFVIATNDLNDITELADFAMTNIEEPEEPQTKRMRQAYQILLNRTHRYAELAPIGSCHVIAERWRDKPLAEATTGSAVSALRASLNGSRKEM